MAVILISGCATLKESIVFGAGSGAIMGGTIGSQAPGDQTENTLQGLVVGGVVGGAISYLIHGSLEKRDANVRRDTLMNLEQYEVLGFENVLRDQKVKTESTQCYTTKEVDGRWVSIPCGIANDSFSNLKGQ